MVGAMLLDVVSDVDFFYIIPIRVYVLLIFPYIYIFYISIEKIGNIGNNKATTIDFKPFFVVAHFCFPTNTGNNWFYSKRETMFPKTRAEKSHLKRDH